MTSKTTSNLERALDASIRAVSEIPDDELINLQSIIERAQVHVMIERHLRSRVSPAPSPLRSVP